MSLELEYLRRAVASSVYDVAKRTPLEPAPNLSERLGVEIWFKREDLQPTFSFKIRGAYACIHQHCQTHKIKGVVAASAGNHAQGVALAAQRLNLAADIVMPKTTPTIKVDAVRKLGATVHLEGDSYDEAGEIARKMATKKRLTFIHPFDDPAVIAGQGTIGLEIINQADHPPKMIFVCVGGGGLVAGVAAVVKALDPDVRIIGVEPEDAACMSAALKAGKPVTLDTVGIFADGAAVRRAGDHTLKVVQQCVDEIVTVTSDEICAAIRDIFEDTRALVEPAGALSVAGIKKYVANGGRLQAPVVAINSGANVNFSRMGHVVERAAIGRGDEALLAVTLPERPGSYLEFLTHLGGHSVTEFNYRYRDPDEAKVFIGLSLEGRSDEPKQTIDTLREAGYPVLDLTHNEMARLHLRHMIGGIGPGDATERVLRFEFPERPGALLEFLRKLGGRWTISLFHYRNHGAAYGRVLVGFLVDNGAGKAFEKFLKSTGYSWTDESDNEAYRSFLAKPG